MCTSTARIRFGKKAHNNVLGTQICAHFPRSRCHPNGSFYSLIIFQWTVDTYFIINISFLSFYKPPLTQKLTQRIASVSPFLLTAIYFTTYDRNTAWHKKLCFFRKQLKLKQSTRHWFQRFPLVIQKHLARHQTSVGSRPSPCFQQ